MSHEQIDTSVEVPTLPILPEELWGDLRSVNPNSYEFKANFQALGELAVSEGYRAPSLEEIFPPEEVIPPAGFTREIIVPQPAIINTDQFKGRIFSIAGEKGRQVEVTIHELTTDMGNRIAVCDLRDQMTSSVRNGGPSEKHDVQALDVSIMSDLKFLADLGHPKRMVTGVKGINYSRVNGTKIRGYWMGVTPESPIEMPLVARIADCGNSIRAEDDLYRRVFGGAVSL